MQTTIFALSSAQGRAGVAVIRLSGGDTSRALVALTGRRIFPPRVAMLCALHHPDGGEVLDRALVLWFRAPASFTGEDVAELHVHGSRAVIDAVLGALTIIGLRLAEPGEFTRRAFENGKMDLTEAEGLADLINADTAMQRRQALAQSSGALRKRYDGWRASLLQAMALVEASLDFTDEADVAANAFALAVPVVRDLTRDLAVALASGRGGEVIRDGIQVAIVGAPNVGKSSLLNALAERNAAIVFDEPGTTRDIVEVTVDIEGYPFVLRDTAGLRETENAVEREGIRRSLAAADSADLVLVVDDGSMPLSASGRSLTRPSSQVSRHLSPWPGLTRSSNAANVDLRNSLDGRVKPGHDVMVILNKMDLASSGQVPLEERRAQTTIRISAKTGQGLDALRSALAAFARDTYGVGESAVITRNRHRQEIEAASAALARFLSGANADQPAELLAEDLREAAHALGRLTGAVDAEDVLGAIFSEFCIGK